MSNLPASWLRCPLGDVVNYGATQKAEPEEIADEAWVLELEDVEKDTSRVLQRMTFKQRQSKSTKNRFAAGDVLYGKLRPYLNKVVFADADGYCTTEIVPIKASEAVKSRYLFHWLKSATFIDYVTSVSHGLNMPRLGTDAGKQAPFVLAPLPEQTRIADKLDAVLARVDACRDRLDRVPGILKRFRQSVLAAATSGKLTEDWRAEQGARMQPQAESGNVARDAAELRYHVTTTPDSAALHPGYEGWTYERAADVCTKVQSGGTPKEGFVDVGIPFLKVYNIVNQQVAFDYKPQYIDTSIHSGSMSKSQVQPGDVLMNIVGPPLGKVAIVPDTHAAWNINQAITLFRPSKRITTGWLYCILCGGENIAEIVHETRGSAGQTNISLSQCRDFVFPVPPMKEQTEIIRRVESLFAYADRLEARYKTARAQVEKLTPALLAKAFRGELVPQDPNDEPAAVLLARIRAGRGDQSAHKPKRGRKAVTV